MIIYSDKLFEKPVDVIQAFSGCEFEDAFNRIEAYAKTHYLAGYVRYEAKEVFLGNHIKSDVPLLYFEVHEKFKAYEPLKPEHISLNLVPDITFEEYKSAVETVKSEIAAGNTYEVNYTYDWTVKYDKDDLMLYECLLQNQKTSYNAFIKNEYDTILSFSPELFFELKNGHIITKPMKGTIGRGNDYTEDEANIVFLQNDEKNRAENVMIVDLLRNDLGRIAKTGTVKVTKLFEIETHKTLHQMTSQIEADLTDGIGFFEIFKAIFPCGSITGAPKISTMKIIDRIEKGARGVYCGAIGFISPEGAQFSVPIRILRRKCSENSFKYRVGGAVVWDSDTSEEWYETVTKTKFLSSDFQLIETIKIQNKSMFLKDEHIRRLRASAEHFGFIFNEEIPLIKPEQDGILRILLNKDGSYETEYKPLEKACTNQVRISDIILDSKNEFVRHKTTYRPWFEESYKQIRNDKVYDEIYFNERGELCEGARCNILLEQNGKFYTPPLSCGLLNGTMRENLLASRVCIEKILYKDDLLNAENIYCINSVRGIKQVELI